MPNAVNYNGQQYIVLGQIGINQSVFTLAINSSKQIIYSGSKTSEQISVADIKYMKYVLSMLNEEIASKNMEFADIYNRVMTINNDFKDRVINDNTIMNYFTPKKNYPAYDEQIVSFMLLNQQGKFNVASLVDEYMDNFTQEQIRILLTNYQLDARQSEELRKRVVTEVESSNSKGKADPGKRLSLALNAFKNSDEGKKSAFIDTLLLTFTVGTLCGIYLMYLILTIMS